MTPMAVVVNPGLDRSGYFQDLLNDSETSLHKSLQSTFGLLFSQNAQVFQDLYSDLRRYYHGYKMNLEEALNDFWARLLEKLVRGMNGRYSMSEDYLECVAKQAETLHPFGETVREFKLKVTRTFVAARSFVQGLFIAGDVVRKVSQVCRPMPTSGLGSVWGIAFPSLAENTITWV
ncbi:hypothetical protein QTP86_002318 [Hemibagrus guttatus]|nr:hypothetical protein QTP86_002318 [Hemibagrus guttatus]